jgi:hypothetical protein
MHGVAYDASLCAEQSIERTEPVIERTELAEAIEPIELAELAEVLIESESQTSGGKLAAISCG